MNPMDYKLFNSALEKDRVLQDISHYEEQLSRARRRLEVIEALERERKLMLETA